MTQRSDSQPRDAAGGREYQTFDEHLAHQPAAFCAKCRAHAQLALARRAPGQQQVRDVHTGHQQHEHHRAHQREKRGPQFADHLFLQGKKHHRPAGIALRLLFLQPGEDAPHLDRRLRERDPLVQARDGVRTAAAALRAELLHRLTIRNQEIGFLTDDREAGRHHADDRSGSIICGERQVEHVPAAAKLSLPEFVAQHDDRVTEIFLGRIGAADRGLDAERSKDVGRDGESCDFERLAVDDHGHGCWSHHAQMVERSRALPPGDEVGRGDHVPLGAAPVGFPHRHDPIGLMVRQRLQHHRAHHAEDRRGRADADGQRRQCRCGKARRPPQHSSAMAEITHGVFEQRRPDLVPCALETAFERAASADRADPRPALCHPSHDASLGYGCADV